MLTLYMNEARTSLFKHQSVLHSKLFSIGYKKQSVNEVTQVAVCSQINTKHVNTVWAERTVVEC
jgi:hypothetical protein